MRNRTFSGICFAVLSVLILATTVWAIKVTLFMDTDTFIRRAKDILIVEVIKVPDGDSQSHRDGLYPVDINILMTLKGDKAKGNATLATIYPVEKGKRYLVSSLGGSAFGTDLLAVPELSVVPLPANLELKTLEGKALNEQVSLIFQQRLAEIVSAQKKLADERTLLEKAAAPPNQPLNARPTPIPVNNLWTAGVSSPSGYVLQGVLGKPIGTYMRIEGVRQQEDMTSGVQTIEVKKVDGQILEHPVSIWVCNLDLKGQTPYTLRGFESIEMIGSPPDPEHPDKTMPQAGFQIRSIFVATEIIAPQGEKLREKK